MPGYGGSSACRVPREMADRIRSREMRALRLQVRDQEGTSLQPFSKRCNMVPHRNSHSTGELTYALSSSFILHPNLKPDLIRAIQVLLIYQILCIIHL